MESCIHLSFVYNEARWWGGLIADCTPHPGALQEGTLADLTSVYHHDPTMVARNIAGEVILVPIRSNVGDLDSIYTLNETAAFVWEHFDGVRTLAEIVAAVVAEFEVETAQAEQDTLALTAQLESVQAIALG